MVVITATALHRRPPARKSIVRKLSRNTGKGTESVSVITALLEPDRAFDARQPPAKHRANGQSFERANSISPSVPTEGSCQQWNEHRTAPIHLSETARSDDLYTQVVSNSPFPQIKLRVQCSLQPR